ncbi:trypsin-1-like [Trichogramma pretiosum]|uniref:trypsin-1-like n=1 Tax=Trichogramma pretiosum TaxID=7493 RepID=UPI0006C9AB4D|nr:trypsin-1-like [Trichogramma pretiosum]
MNKMESHIVVLCCLLAITFAEETKSPQIDAELIIDPLKINRIVGGHPARSGEFPHQVSLQLGRPPIMPYQHMCGGSILDEQWILTAGHCVKHLPDQMYLIVKAGKLHIHDNEPSEQTANVASIFINRNYKGDVAPFDIALLKLAKPLVFSKMVQPIGLPKANAIPEGVATLSGWGSTSKTSTPNLPNHLQKVNLPLLDIETCRKAMRLVGQVAEVHDTNVCTGPLSGGHSSCSGDSGGPLILHHEHGPSELIGVVSWGVVPCGSPGAPAVFVRVSAFNDWIQSIIQNN